MKLFLALVLWIGGEGIAAGVQAYRDGDFEQAYLHFTAAAEAAGERASAELLYDRALAAARLGMWVEMEAAAARAAEQGGPPFEARRDFLRGNAAYARSQAAAGRAAIGGSVGEWGKAILLGEAARLSWQAAATSRADWPEARRNVERAARALAEMRRQRQEAKQKAGDRPDPPPDAAPPDAPPPDFEPPPELTPEELQALLEQLAQQELDKREQRRKRPRTGGAVRDW